MGAGKVSITCVNCSDVSIANALSSSYSLKQICVSDLESDVLKAGLSDSCDVVIYVLPPTITPRHKTNHEKFLIALKKAFPSVPVILVAEAADPSLIFWAWRIQLRDYILWPLEAPRLVQSVAEITRFKQMSQIPRTPISSGFAPDLKPAENGRTEVAAAYIRGNFSAPITVENLARICELSVDRFTRLFKEEHGTNVTRYVLRQRVNAAKHLLDQGAVRVSQVAFQVGFNDVSHFNRIFKKFVGLSPTAYRAEKFSTS